MTNFVSNNQNSIIMRKLYSLFIALVFVFLSNAYGQDAIVTIPDLVLPSGNIEVPLEVDFTLEDVCSFQLYIHFDEANLTFKGIANAELAGILHSPADSPSPILINWFAPFVGGSPVPAGIDGKLLDMLFEYNGNDSAIGFVLVPPTDSAVGDCVLAEDFDLVIFNDGSLRLAPPVPISNWAIVAGLVMIIAFVIIKRSRFL